MYFFDRPKISISSKNEIILYTSITDYYLLSYKPIKFNFDFTSSKIQINKKNLDCTKKNHCYIQKESQAQEKKDLKNSSLKIKTFIGLKKLSAGEITNKQAKDVSQMEVELTENTDYTNKLGLGPYSEFFIGLQKEFYFKNFLLNITYSNYKEHEHFRFYSRIDESEILVDGGSKHDFYSFQGETEIGDFKKKTSFCVSSQNEEFFFLKEDLYDEVMKGLCNPLDCVFERDLKNDDFYFFLILSNGDFLTKNFRADIFSKDLYYIEEGRVFFKFRKLENKFFSDCDVVLEKRFFESFYLLITKNLQNGNVSVGFRRIIPSNFIIEDLWKYMLGLFIFSLVFLIGGNIVLYCLSKKKRNKKKLGLMEEDYVILKKNLNLDKERVFH